MNVEPDPVPNNAFVLIVLLLLIKVTGMICRKGEGDALELNDSSLFETNSFVLSSWSKVWCFWEQPSFRQVNFDGHTSSWYYLDEQFLHSLFVWNKVFFFLRKIVSEIGNNSLIYGFCYTACV